jgi:hypothetical protein
MWTDFGQLPTGRADRPSSTAKLRAPRRTARDPRARFANPAAPVVQVSEWLVAAFRLNGEGLNGQTVASLPG